MLCAISGEAPQAPVASRKSGKPARSLRTAMCSLCNAGNVFEKRLIEAYIAENGKDPVTGEELENDDLIDLQSPRIVRPRPPTLTSIPSLLSTFQNEWDALALETYTIRQQLAQTRQELSTALYQHDAAVRVIARLTRERDEARDALSKVTVNGPGGTSNGDAMQVDGQGLPEAILAKVEATQEKLSKTRRKRVVPEDWATAESIRSYRPFVTSESLFSGSRSVAIDSSGDLALAGGVGGTAGVYSISQKVLINTLQTGGGDVTDTLWWGGKAVISSTDGSVKIYENEREVASLRSHSGEVTALSLHPSGEVLASVGVDKSYVLYDLFKPKTIAQVFTDSGNLGLTTAGFHPDGHLFAAGGADGQIRIFDVKSGAIAASFDSTGPVQSLSFSENGTWLAAAANGQSTITIWDLRKAAQTKVLDVGNNVESVRWDYTGQFLVSTGPSGTAVQQYSKSTKAWTEVLQIAVPAVAVQWGPRARTIVAVSAGGVVNVLGAE
ncbi:MAG: hypothetical protein M1812_004118 [Candelaria pacifica]|nr:MAG: hypothetical protein M1812_004118 [Candelaria pacifica]